MSDNDPLNQPDNAPTPLLWVVEATHYTSKVTYHDTTYVIADNEGEVLTYLTSLGLDLEDEYYDELDEHDPPQEWWDTNPNAVARAEALGLTVKADVDGTPTQPYSAAGPRRDIVRWLQAEYDEPEDVYYGVTQHSWEVRAVVTETEAAALVHWGVAVDLRGLA